MSLSVSAITVGNAYAARFLSEFRDLAHALDAEFVVAGDGAQGLAMAERYADVVVPVQTRGGLAETVIAALAHACVGEWMLRFDDDETCSEAMREWLLRREWERGTEKVYSFPYAWLWGDEEHFITSHPFWTDAHARLMPREMMMQWSPTVHAGNPFGIGTLVPVAHCHHKFLVRTFQERQETARRYDALAMGAGTGAYYGKFTLPEVFCSDLLVREVGRGDVELGAWIETGERVVCSRKTGTGSTPFGKSAWNTSRIARQAELR